VAGAGAMNDQMADAAKTAAPRLGCGPGEGGTDRSVNGGAARAQDVGADGSRGTALRGDNAPF
jgi:hypothetical protein